MLKNKIFLRACMLLGFFLSCCVAGCTTTPTRLSADELSEFKIDCNKRQEQHDFLESQKYTEWERIKLALQLTSIPGILANMYNGTAQDTSAGMAGEHEVFIKHKQRKIREHCRSVDYTKWQQEQTQQFIRQREAAAR
jgi:hypothetical protein